MASTHFHDHYLEQAGTSRSTQEPDLSGLNGVVIDLELDNAFVVYITLDQLLSKQEDGLLTEVESAILFLLRKLESIMLHLGLSYQTINQDTSRWDKSAADIFGNILLASKELPSRDKQELFQPTYPLLSHVVLKSNRGQAQLEIPKVPGVICCKGYAALMCLPRQQQQEQKQEAKADQQLGDKAGAGDVFGFALFRNGAEKVVHLLDKLQQGTQQQHYTGPSLQVSWHSRNLSRLAAETVLQTLVNPVVPANSKMGTLLLGGQPGQGHAQLPIPGTSSTRRDADRLHSDQHRPAGQPEVLRLSVQSAPPPVGAPGAAANPNPAEATDPRCVTHTIRVAPMSSSSTAADASVAQDLGEQLIYKLQHTRLLFVKRRSSGSSIGLSTLIRELSSTMANCLSQQSLIEERWPRQLSAGCAVMRAVDADLVSYLEEGQLQQHRGQQRARDAHSAAVAAVADCKQQAELKLSPVYHFLGDVQKHLQSEQPDGEPLHQPTFHAARHDLQLAVESMHSYSNALSDAGKAAAALPRDAAAYMSKYEMAAAAVGDVLYNSNWCGPASLSWLHERSASEQLQVIQTVRSQVSQLLLSLTADRQWARDPQRYDSPGRTAIPTRSKTPPRSPSPWAPGHGTSSLSTTQPWFKAYSRLCAVFEKEEQPIRRKHQSAVAAPGSPSSPSSHGAASNLYSKFPAPRGSPKRKLAVAAAAGEADGSDGTEVPCAVARKCSSISWIGMRHMAEQQQQPQQQAIYVPPSSSAAAAAADPDAAAAAAAVEQCKFDEFKLQVQEKFRLHWSSQQQALPGLWLAFAKQQSAISRQKPGADRPTDVPATKQHIFLSGVPAIAAAEEMMDKTDKLSSSDVRTHLMQCLLSGDIHVKVTRQGYQTRAYPERLVVKYSAVIQLPMFQRLQQASAAAAAAGNDPLPELVVDNYAMSNEDKFTEQQLPDAALLRLGVQEEVQRAPLPAGADPRQLTAEEQEVVKQLQPALLKQFNRALVAYLRWQLPWQLTPQQHSHLQELLLDAGLWELWEKLAPLAACDPRELGATLTFLVRGM